LQPKDPADDLAEPAVQIDSLLLAYMQATDESESQHLAAQLISEYAEPVIAGVLRYKLGVALHFAARSASYDEAEDISGEVILENCSPACGNVRQNPWRWSSKIFAAWWR
jgi:hypothetical protein